MPNQKPFENVLIVAGVTGTAPPSPAAVSVTVPLKGVTTELLTLYAVSVTLNGAPDAWFAAIGLNPKW